MIERRHKSFVTSNGLVPVDAIANDIGRGCEIERLKMFYPKLTDEDIFEVIDFYADNTTIPNLDSSKLLVLENTGDEDSTVIEVVHIHQIVYIKLLSISRRYYKDITNFVSLMNIGLRIICLQNIEHYENEEELPWKIHKVVNSALLDCVPDIMSEKEETKKDLDYNEYLERKKLYQSRTSE